MKRLTSVVLALVISVFLVAEATGQTRKFYVPYKVRTSRVAQSGTSAPSDSVWYNAIGGTWTWAYSSKGLYTLTKTGGGMNTHTTVFISPGGTRTGAVNWTLTNDSVITFSSQTGYGILSDSVINGAALEIRQYP